MANKLTTQPKRSLGALFGFMLGLGVLTYWYINGSLVPGQEATLLRSVATALIVLVSVFGHLLIGRWVTNTADKVEESETGQAAEVHLPDWRLWVHIIVSILWWLVPGAALVWLWGMWGESREAWQTVVWGGIKLGEMTVVPGKIGIGLAVIIVLLIVTRWIKNQLEHRWLLRTPLEAATRNTVATIFSYVTFIIAVLLGLDMAGLQLSKLALVAGALSVGIGFGLQNVVNNFVSGLILTFERPIRVGDFISVAGHEGFVKKLKIRATEIETLDRINVVVPNSELISNALINWTLHDRWGRIKADVGVAYGSDTQLVKRILEQVTNSHDAVIKAGGIVPGPEVLFKEFGDSSLNFSVRFFIKEITRRYQVISDINFAIDAAFREHNVNIPFPQRDLWLKSVPDAQTKLQISDE